MGLIPVSKPRVHNMLRLATVFDSIMARAWLTNDGPTVRALEEQVAARLGVQHFVAMANGTLALEASVRVLFKPGSVVAIPSFTFVAVASALVNAGCHLRFIDIDPNTWTAHWCHAKTMLARIAGFMVPNTFGIAPNHKFSVLGIPVIYDNAEGFGTHRGMWGGLDAYSFHATKVVNAAEGGGVATNDDGVATLLRQWRNFGFDNQTPGGVAVTLGTNAKMSELHAAWGLLSLGDEYIEKKARQELLDVYRTNLHGVVRFQQGQPLQCVVLVENRDKVALALKAEGIDSRPYFYPIHRMPPFQKYAEPDMPLAATDYVAARALALPLWSGLRVQDVERICKIVRETEG